MPNTKQISLARTLLSQTGSNERKDYIVLGFTAERTTHISDMTEPEFKALIKHLKGLVPGAKKAETMRRKIISMAHEMGWWQKDGTGKLKLKDGKAQVDIKALDGWAVKFGYLKKKLDAYNVAELPKLVSQFERVKTDYLNKAKKQL